MAASTCKDQMTLYMYVAICTHSSGYSERDLHLVRCIFPLDNVLPFILLSKTIPCPAVRHQLPLYEANQTLLT